jgi:hypothetical protein
MRSGATNSAGRAKKDLGRAKKAWGMAGRSWRSVVAMGVAWGMGGDEIQQTTKQNLVRMLAADIDMQ